MFKEHINIGSATVLKYRTGWRKAVKLNNEQ